MQRKYLRLILMIGMLVCFAGMVYSYTVEYQLGFIINTVVFILLLLSWMSTYKRN